LRRRRTPDASAYVRAILLQRSVRRVPLALLCARHPAEVCTYLHSIHQLSREDMKRSCMLCSMSQRRRRAASLRFGGMWQNNRNVRAAARLLPACLERGACFSGGQSDGKGVRSAYLPAAGILPHVDPHLYPQLGEPPTEGRRPSRTRAPPKPRFAGVAAERLQKAGSGERCSTSCRKDAAVRRLRRLQAVLSFG